MLVYAYLRSSDQMELDMAEDYVPRNREAQDLPQDPRRREIVMKNSGHYVQLTSKVLKDGYR